MRLRGGEKALYKAINSASAIKFPLQVDIVAASHKRSLIIQAELGAVDFPADEQFKKHRSQYQQDVASIFSNVHRLLRCIADCLMYLQDGQGMRHALELGRSLGARAWDKSPWQMKQIPGIGPVAVRKLVAGGINSIESLETSEAFKINSLLSKNPGFGEKLLDGLKRFPKPRVSVRLINKVREKSGSLRAVNCCLFRLDISFRMDTIGSPHLELQKWPITDRRFPSRSWLFERHNSKVLQQEGGLCLLHSRTLRRLSHRFQAYKVWRP